MKFDKMSSAVSSDRRTQISTAVLVTSIAAVLGIGIVISSPIMVAVTDAAQSALVSGKVANGIATPVTTASVIGSNITFGTPKFLGIEYGKTISLQPAVVNGTPGSQAAIRGNAVLNGINITINGKVFLARSSGSIHSQGDRIWMVRDGSDGMATYTFLGIEHYGIDGKLRGTTFDTVKATGKLAFLSNVIVIDKHEVDKAGNIISKFWELK